MSTDNNQLPAGDDQEMLESGDDLAKKALAAASTDALPAGDDDEVTASNQVAETVMALQGVIDRNASELDRVSKELKEHRDSLRNVFDNDAELSESKMHVDQYTEQVKSRRSQLQGDPQVVSLKNKIGELNEQKKEIEEALSNHLVNYYSLTNSTSFDTSEGDQREFIIRAKVKGRR